MKKYFFLSLVLLAVIFGCSNNPINSSKEQSAQPTMVASGCTQSAAMKAWEALTQTARDDKIINLANSQIGGTDAGQCKGWVQHVVKAASNQAIDIPATNPTDQRYWYTDPCMPVYGRSTMIENVGRADILQMYYNVRLKDGSFAVGPHTAFVLSKNATSMTWLDCNFVGPGANRIGTHTVTYADFKLFTTPTTKNPNLGWNVYHVQ
jgi:hypothetical protein